MKLKKSIFSLIASILFFNTSHSQNFSKQISEKYPASIISRVYEVTVVAKLPQAKQLLLAEFYTRKDSLVTLEISKNSTPGKIDSLFVDLQIEFESILGTAGIAKYSSTLTKSYREKEAKAMSQFLKNKYHTSPVIENSFYNIFIEKSANLSRIFSTIEEADVAEKIGTEILTRYDSLYDNYITAAKGEPYYNRQFTLLSDFKPLNQQQINVLHNNYINLCLKKGNNYYKNFHTALQFATSDKDYFQFLYKDSVENEITNKSKKELENISYRYGLPKSILEKIKPVVFSRIREQTKLETYTIYNPVQDSLRREIDERSLALIRKILIREGYYGLSDSRFANAMKYEKPLHLNNSQMDSLAEQNYQLEWLAYKAEVKTPWEKFDAQPFTTANFERIFTPGQFDTLLRIETRPAALSNTYRDWFALKNYKLTDDLDSASTFTALFSYNMSCLILSKRYAGNRIVLEKLMKTNLGNRPQVLNKLDAAIRQEEWNADSQSKIKPTSTN